MSPSTVAALQAVALVLAIIALTIYIINAV